jgi:ribonuclease-3
LVALRGGFFLAGGLAPPRRFIELTFLDDLERIDEEDLLFQDYKTALQELAQGAGLSLPDYNVVGEIGPDHGKTFIVEVRVGGNVSRGEGSSKKEAQQQAAREAMKVFDDVRGRNGG